MADNDNDNVTVIPLAGQEDEAEREAVRRSNDRDQELERQGEQSKHNRGYDEAADGIVRRPAIERVVDE